MYKAIIRTASVLAVACLPFSASALSITVTETTTDLAAAQSNFKEELDKLAYFTIEDFETFKVGQADFDADTKTLKTNVGSLTFSGAAGAGGAATGDKTFGRIADAPAFGRLNTSSETFGGEGITSGDHSKYLESNDVQTMTWSVSDKVLGRQFDRLLFSITDAADNRATFVIIDAENNSTEYTLTGGKDREIRNFVVSFASLQSSAKIQFTNLNSNVNNDGVGFDNMVVGAVPLPAALWLLLGVSGALVAAKRRSARKMATA